jgi:hypothetical protein
LLKKAVIETAAVAHREPAPFPVQLLSFSALMDPGYCSMHRTKSVMLGFVTDKAIAVLEAHEFR